MRHTKSDSLCIRLDHEILVLFKTLCAQRGDTPQARLRAFIRRSVQQGKRNSHEKAVHPIR